MSINAYILKMKSLADNLTAAGQVTIDQDVVMSVLNGLGLEYDSVIVHITSRQDVIPLSEAQYLLMTQEKRMEQYHSSALVNLSNIAAHFASNDKRSYKGGNNSGRSGNNRCGRRKGFNRSKIMCQLCGKSGHILSMCYKRFDQQFQGLNIQ
ncbi:hypothetical protein ACOSQ2_022567 [Xanthoceras sorbifolium]